jgi:prepilin-type N-terminal cleavage/methylation domain-containing protein
MMRLQQTGFTLVETLVTVAITGVLVTVLTGFMLANLESSTLASARATQLQETEQSLDIAANDIRLSATADASNRWPDVNDSGGISNPYSWQSDASNLILATAAQTTGKVIIFSDPNNYVTEKNNIIYFVNNGTLYRRILATSVGGNRALTTCPADKASNVCPADNELLHNVTLFNVSYINGQNNNVASTSARSIELHVIVSTSRFGQAVTSDYTTRMVFRNG